MRIQISCQFEVILVLLLFCDTLKASEIIKNCLALGSIISKKKRLKRTRELQVQIFEEKKNTKNFMENYSFDKNNI